MVLVGLPPEAPPVPVFDLLPKGVSVVGSIVGTRKDLREALELAARGLVRCNHTTASMEEINDVFGEMRAGKIDGRVVLKIR
jgi:propanol-preferring alcohol dehydrogenase